VGGPAVEPAGKGEAGPLNGEDFVFDDVAVVNKGGKGDWGGKRRNEHM